MSNTIQIKRSSTASSVPTTGQLAQGELAVNLVDKKLYTKDNTNAVVQLNPEFNINGLTTTAVDTNDFLPFADTSNSGVNRKATVADILALGISTNNILAATAGASVGAVGTYAHLRRNTIQALSPGTTIPGSQLVFSNNNALAGSGVSGTWRLMGQLGTVNTPSEATSVWLRIS
jgi:hypothetical protein